MTTSVKPFLMFEGRAEEAISFYVATIPGSAILHIQRWAEGGPGTPGKIMVGTVRIGGLEVMVSDSPIKHGFTFTPSSSLFVTCESEAEIDRFASVLADGGGVLMPLGAYGFSRKFAWVNDRFGVSWQFNLP